MKKLLFHINIFLCVLLLLNPSITAGEENQNILSLEELSIKVMPEFAYHPNDIEKENPPLLIGYQGTMRNQSSQPQKGQIEIPLPISDKNFRIGYVADYSSDLTKVYEIEYIFDQEKGTISWTTSEDIQPNDVYKFVIEFYTDNIMVENEKKSLSYQFNSFTDIGLFSISFIEPLKAKKVVLDPPVEKQNTHADEEEGVHSYFIQGLKDEEERSFTLTYEREETTPTVEMMEQEKQQPKDTLENKNNPAILSIAAVSGVGLLAAGAFAHLMRRKQEKR